MAKTTAEVPPYLDFDKIGERVGGRLKTVEQQEIEGAFSTFTRLVKMYKIATPIYAEQEPSPMLIEPWQSRHYKLILGTNINEIRSIRREEYKIVNNYRVKITDGEEKPEEDLGPVDNKKLLANGCKLIKDILAEMKKVAKPLDPTIFVHEEEADLPFNPRVEI